MCPNWTICGLILLLTCGAAPAAEAPRNVVLIVVDDQGFEAGCYGNQVIKTPNIDRLAQNGVRFTRYATTASCSASRSVLLSGLYNHATGHYGHAHGYNHFSTYEGVRSLPVLLAEAGYRTCSIGKYHLAPNTSTSFRSTAMKGFTSARNSVRMAANARSWISENDDRPFFLYFCTSDPHRGGGADGFSNFNDDPQHYPGVTPVRYSPQDVVVPPWMSDTPESRGELAEFYQAISRLDQGVGALLDALEETGHWDDTLVMFLSDNGPPFPGAKTTAYEPGLNLPLIVRDPQLSRQGTTNDALVNWADITPTILDYCKVSPSPAPPIRERENTGRREQNGKPQPYRFHGRSFLQVLGDDSPEGWDETFGSHTFHEITMYYPMRVVMGRRYKYIFNIAHPLPFPFASDLQSSPTWQGVLERGDSQYGQRTVDAYLHRPRHELYDLQTDPHETKNLADDPAHAETLARLQKKLKGWQKATGDPWILKWDYE